MENLCLFFYTLYLNHFENGVSFVSFQQPWYEYTSSTTAVPQEQPSEKGFKMKEIENFLLLQNAVGHTESMGSNGRSTQCGNTIDMI